MNIGDTFEYNFKSWELCLKEIVDGIEIYHFKEIGNPENGICFEARYIN